MKVVVADTSPLNYLIWIGEIELLPRLYGSVLIPDVVAAELRDPDAPALVASWAANLPPWIDLRPTPVSTEEFERLDAGERAAILLAEAQQPPILLLIDDSDGRAEAERRHIPVTGTLGIIRAAALDNLIDLPKALKNLRGTNFRCSPNIINELLAEDAERRRTR
jgi:predicted nucleic acid-binding protein